jgi:hypothetical protein
LLSKSTDLAASVSKAPGGLAKDSPFALTITQAYKFAS